jgi:hypothetical protein
MHLVSFTIFFLSEVLGELVALAMKMASPPMIIHG